MATHAATTRNISGLARAMAQHGLMTEQEAESQQSQAQQAGITFVEKILDGIPDPTGQMYRFNLAGSLLKASKSAWEKG